MSNVSGPFHDDILKIFGFVCPKRIPKNLLYYERFSHSTPINHEIFTMQEFKVSFQ